MVNVLKLSSFVYNHAMKSDEIIRRLRREGWRKAHQAGSHVKFRHPEKPGSVTVPHPKKDLPIGTIKSIFEQAGWAWKQRN
jgi:predicted RNA binding protein YcfA (HicA-like mRNA interferase family)